MVTPTKRCPFCAEEIHSDAIKCKHCGSMLTEFTNYSSSDSATFTKLALANKYDLLEKIGEGGMASVYKATQKNLGRTVALKVIHQNLIHDKEFLERFHREARASASLTHPNIVTIYDEGIENGVHYIAMEYLDGTDLHSLIKSKGKLPVEWVVSLISPIADALDYAHRKEIVHRDIKSANIIVTETGRPVLTDFGIAHATSGTKLTQAGSVFGTPEYMSPEQADGEDVDGRSDLFSLGIVMYECLAGDVPFKGDNPITTVYKVINSEAQPIKEVRRELPEWISTVIQKSLSKPTGLRFQTGKEFSNALQSKKTYDIERPKSNLSRKSSDQHTSKLPHTKKITYSRITEDTQKSRVMTYFLGISILIVLIVIVVILTKGSGGSAYKDIEDSNWEKLSANDKKNVEILLNRGDELYLTNNLITPDGGSAYTYYKRTLDIHQTNKHAIDKLNAIYLFYFNEVKKFVDKGDKNSAQSLASNIGSYFPLNRNEINSLLSEVELNGLIVNAKTLSANLNSRENVNDLYLLAKQILSISPNNSIGSTFIGQVKDWYNNEIANAISQKQWEYSIKLIETAYNYFEGDHYVEKLNEIKQYQKQTEIQNRLNNLLQQAQSNINNYRWDDAIQKFEEALRVDPNNSRAKNGKSTVIEAIIARGDALYNSGSYSQAYQQYQKALSLKPGDTRIQIKLTKSEEKK